MSKKKPKPAVKSDRSGSLAPVDERTWAHRVVDHVVAAERDLGSSRRPPAGSA